MTITLTPRIAVHQHHIPEDPSIDMIALNGQTRIKEFNPTLVDTVEDEVIDAEREAQGKAALAFTQNLQAIAEGQFNFDQMTGSEQKQAVERAFYPIIKTLSKKHVQACAEVTDFEETEATFKSKLKAEYAYNANHHSIKKILCSGDYHFQNMLQTGQLDLPGMKLVDRRSLGERSFHLVFIPSDVTSLLSYADSPEAQAIADNEYDLALQKLIRKRKAAAMQLAQAKQQARDALSQVTSFEDLLSDGIKRGRK